MWGTVSSNRPMWGPDRSKIHSLEPTRFRLQVLRVLHDVVYLHQELKGEISGRRLFVCLFVWFFGVEDDR